MYWPSLKYIALLVPEIIGIGVLSGGCEPSFQRKGAVYRGSEMVPSERALVSSYRPSIQIIPLSALVCSKFQIGVLGGMRTPILGKRRPQGVGDGAVRKSVGEFLQAFHSNFSSVFTCFRDIATLVLQHATFPPPHLYSLPKIFPCSPGFWWMAFGL